MLTHRRIYLINVIIIDNMVYSYIMLSDKFLRNVWAFFQNDDLQATEKSNFSKKLAKTLLNDIFSNTFIGLVLDIELSDTKTGLYIFFFSFHIYMFECNHLLIKI